MTCSEILALTGRDLDRAVAEARKVKTRRIELYSGEVFRGEWFWGGAWCSQPEPVSSDIAAAMRLLGEMPCQVGITFYTDGSGCIHTVWDAPIISREFPTLADLPAAICQAWLMLQAELSSKT